MILKGFFYNHKFNMQSFRTELENPVVERDIIELEKKIRLFREGKIDEERFRSLRLARGVYGQRQLGVQMVRIKIPYGYLNADKLLRICDVSEEYSKGRLHITTRQDIQIHHVSLDRTPELWAELEKDEITLREACGNTVRNVTASATSGIDNDEPFDPRPYVDALFKYFLRNPICQEMGRKFKISFSNTDKDTALAFMHDIGFIAKAKEINGKTEHGFKVLVAGGLGSQPLHAHVYSEFLPANQIIPFTEAALRIFERNGERSRRMKARLKFLVKEWGFEKFKTFLEEELLDMNRIHEIEYIERAIKLPYSYSEVLTSDNSDAFRLWKDSNVFKQNNGLYAIGVKVRLGDLYTNHARKIAAWVKDFSGDELTLTINQNFIIRHVEESVLYTWFKNLESIGLSEIGFDKFNDPTACPGTDTCNLGIASSTGLARVLEKVVKEEYSDLVKNESLDIKLSGCMNACGQHNIASIGFQGMSMKSKDKRVLPATQILLGGGRMGNGEGRFADKVIKVPSKRAPQALRTVLDDYKANGLGRTFYNYYDTQGEKYFYGLLKHLSDIESLEESDFIDWGHSANYIKAIGIGECAGVVVDLISTLFFESEEKLELAKRSIEQTQFQDSIYHTYSSIVNTAKALLTAEGHKSNSQVSIVSLFDEEFVEKGKFKFDVAFADFVFGYRKQNATEEYAKKYYEQAVLFYKQADQYRKKELES